SENAASSSSTLFDQQDLHILEALLFNDEDQGDEVRDATPAPSMHQTMKMTSTIV
ncbi:hypothetical protein Gpo141_00013727, partial [Globisporangium polare]